MGSGKVFILRWKSYIYIMKNKGLGTDPWETPCFKIPPVREIMF
jgi:hypothetical protein